MNKFSLIIAFALITLSASRILSKANESHWAVLVAGSNGFWNYRHQSDICHSYHLLIKNGMNANRIITLAYDDIASDSENPIQGKIFNKPDPTGEGIDVYAGCKLDYTGEDVNPQVFLNVLKGDAAGNKGKGNGRVLKSTATDKVFVYFSDHGATGLIAFPSEELYADDLITALKYMNTKKLYKRLVFYLEACESGSMFKSILPNNMEIYATTAADENESSWATYCNPDDNVNGTNIGTCLGDEYSVNWMEDTEGSDVKSKKLQKQFEDVKTKTEGSHVQQYGIIAWAKDEVLSNYQGDVVSLIDKIFNKVQQCANKLYYLFNKEKLSQLESYELYLEKAKQSRINSRDAKLHYLSNKHTKLGTIETESKLNSEIAFRHNLDLFFNRFNKKFNISEYQNIDSVSNFECLKRSVSKFKSSCKKLWDEYSLKFIKQIYLACEKTTTEEIESYFNESC